MYKENMPEDINVILYHATKKEKLPTIMKNGLKPGTGKGGMTILPALSKKGAEYATDYVYFYPSFGVIQSDYQLFKDTGIDTILIMGMPADRSSFLWKILPLENMKISMDIDKNLKIF